MTNYAILFCFLLIYAAFGRKILGFLTVKDLVAEEKPLFSIALGLGASSLLLFALGCLGFIYGWIIFFLFVAIIIFSASEFIPAGHDLASSVTFLFSHFRKRSVLLALFLLLLTSFVLINLLSALVPVTEYDSLSYHLFTPKKYIAHHSFYPMPDSLQSYWPLAVEITYIPFLLLGRPELASLLSFAMGIFIVYLIIVFINKYISQNPLVSALAALLFYCQPVVNLLSTTPKIDLAFTFFSLLILFSLFNWYYKDDNKWLWLASIFLGLTASIKLTGIFFFPIFFVGVIIALLSKKNKPTYASSLTYAFLPACAFSSLALLFFLPWLLRTFIWTGDPIYPFLTSFNGHRYTFIGGHDKTFLQYLRLFWDITFHAEKFFGDWVGQLPPYFLALFPMLFFVRKKLTSIIITLLLISLAYINVLFFTGFGTRYLLPVIVLFSSITAFVYFNFLEKLNRKTAIILSLIILVSFSCDLWVRRNAFVNFKLPVILGRQGTNFYLAKNDPWNNAKQALIANDHLPPNAKIFSANSSCGYYFNQDFIAGTLELSRYYEDFEQVKSAPAAIEKLKAMGITHLAINTQYLDAWWRQNLLFRFYTHKLGGRNLFANPFYQPETKDFLDQNYDCVYYDPYIFDRSQFYSQNVIDRLLEAINKDNYGVNRVENLEQLNALLVKPDWFTIWSRKKTNKDLSQGIIPKSILKDNPHDSQSFLALFFKNPADESLIIKYDKLEELVKIACTGKDNSKPAKSLVETLQPILLLKNLAKKTSRYPSDNLLSYQQREITRLNRLTIELTYPTICPQDGNTTVDHFIMYKL
ncbi:MAG: phospholipid carrier-dependent glycosyltransferase [bacterium]